MTKSSQRVSSRRWEISRNTSGGGCRRVTPLIVILTCLVGGACAAEPQPQRMRGVDLRQRYDELLVGSGHLQPYDWSRTPQGPEMRKILEEYFRRVRKIPGEAGRVRAVVIDEALQPLEGVHVSVKWSDPNGFFKDPKVTARKNLIANHSVDLRFDGHLFIDIELSKAGYRTVTANFSSNDRVYQFPDELSEIHSSCVRPAPDDAELLYLMMPPQVRWEPEGYSDELSAMPDEKDRPKIVGDSAPVLARSDRPSIALAPRRATYVLADGQGKVLRLRRLDPNFPLGFEKDERNNIAAVSYFGGELLVSKFPPESGPYTWRLYAEAKPVAPQDAARADAAVAEGRGGREPARGAPGASAGPRANAADQPIRPAGKAPVDAAPRQFADLMRAREQRYRRMYVFYRRSINEDERLSAAQKKTVLRVIDQREKEMDAVWKRLREGKDILMSDVIAPDGDSVLGQRLLDSMEDKKWIEYTGHRMVMESIIVQSLVPPSGSSKSLRERLAKLNLDAKQQAVADEALRAHEQRAKEVLKKWPKETKQYEDSVAQWQIESQVVVSGYDAWEQIRQVLTKAQLEQFLAPPH